MIAKQQARIHSVLNSTNLTFVWNATVGMNWMLITFVKKSQMLMQMLMLLRVLISKTVLSVTPQNVQSVSKDIDNNMCLGNVYCLQPTVLKNVPYALQMNVSPVLKGILRNLSHHVSTVRSCMLVTRKESAKLSFQTVRLFLTVSHVLLDNAEDVNQDSNWTPIKNVLLSEQ